MLLEDHARLSCDKKTNTFHSLSSLLLSNKKLTCYKNRKSGVRMSTRMPEMMGVASKKCQRRTEPVDL